MTFVGVREAGDEVILYSLGRILNLRLTSVLGSLRKGIILHREIPLGCGQCYLENHVGM